MADGGTFMPTLIYKDPRAAMDWLGQAFGFEVAMLLADANGAVAHAEMSYGNGVVVIGYEWLDWTKSPTSAGGANTQFIRVQVPRGIDAHCERARQAGARIIQEPADQFYGARTYRAFDVEGHCWTFNQFIRSVSTEDMEKASGLTFKKAPA